MSVMDDHSLWDGMGWIRDESDILSRPLCARGIYMELVQEDLTATIAFSGGRHEAHISYFVWRNQTDFGRDESSTQIRDSKGTSPSSTPVICTPISHHAPPAHAGSELLECSRCTSIPSE